MIEIPHEPDARDIVPPAFRDRARVTALNVFTLTDDGQLLSAHRGKPGTGEGREPSR